MDKFRSIYQDKRGIVPANESVIRLKCELEEEQKSCASKIVEEEKCAINGSNKISMIPCEG